VFAALSFSIVHQPVHLTILAALGSSKAMVALQYPIMILGSVAVFLFYEEPAREWTSAKPVSVGLARS
jgi:peptidoglycan/LPS O-acetylase OafA/YrhL